MTDLALSGIKVIDLTHYIAGPYCTKLLADYGADVIKIEKPGEGDPARRIGPFFEDTPHPEKSGLFLHLNTNKRGMTLNLKTEAGRRIFLALVGQSNIIVENFKPGVMHRLGIDYEALREANPKLVMTSISNFGQNGPYRDYKASELTLFAMGGAMNANGVPQREPLKKPGNVVQYHAGAVAALASLVALYASRQKDSSEYVDISILETQMGSIDRRMSHLLSYQYVGETTPREDQRDEARLPPFINPCQDGYFHIWGGFYQWPKVARLLGRTDLIADPKLTTPEGQLELRDYFNSLWFPWIMERSKREITELAQAAGIGCAPIYTMDEVLDDPHLKLRDFFVEVEHPATGVVSYPGAPFKGEMSHQIRRAAPLLGQHNQEVLRELGYSDDNIIRLKERGVI